MNSIRPKIHSRKPLTFVNFGPVISITATKMSPLITFSTENPSVYHYITLTGFFNKFLTILLESYSHDAQLTQIQEIDLSN